MSELTDDKEALRDAYFELEAEADRLRALAWELKVEYIDALHQGAGVEPLSSPTWHMHMSTYEYADEFLRRPDVVALTDPGHHPTEVEA